MIPKIIHQVWIGKENPQPTEWMSTFPAMYPDWEYRLWTEDNLPNLVNKSIFDDEARNHTRTNIIRYEILLRFGGVYFDCDMEALKPIPDEFLSQEFFCAYESERWVPGLIPAAAFGAEPGHPILATLVHSMKGRDQTLPSWKFNGTQFVTDTVNGYAGKKTIHPSETFYPQHFRDEVCDPRRSDLAYTFHYWSTTKLKWKAPRY